MGGDGRGTIDARHELAALLRPRDGRDQQCDEDGEEDGVARPHVAATCTRGQRLRSAGGAPIVRRRRRDYPRSTGSGRRATPPVRDEPGAHAMRSGLSMASRGRCTALAVRGAAPGTGPLRCSTRTRTRGVARGRRRRTRRRRLGPAARGHPARDGQAAGRHAVRPHRVAAPCRPDRPAGRRIRSRQREADAHRHRPPHAHHHHAQPLTARSPAPKSRGRPLIRRHRSSIT